MKFENPFLLNLLWSLLLQALLLFIYWRWRRRVLGQLGSAELADRLLLGFSKSRFWLKNLLFAAVLTLIVLALANPLRKTAQTLPEQKSADVLIALDISESMLAADVLPDRLKKAKSFVKNLVQALEGERLGLIFFAGDAFAQMPLSTDHESLLTFVGNASPEFINDPSSDLAAPIEVALRLFGTDPEAGCALILISDGESTTRAAGDPVAAAQKANAQGMVVHTVSVGSISGGPVPLASGGNKRDAEGRTVISRADENLLRDLAQAGGGSALKIDDPQAAGTIAREVARLQKKAVRAETGVAYSSFYQWLVGLALLFLAIDQWVWWRRKV